MKLNLTHNPKFGNVPERIVAEGIDSSLVNSVLLLPLISIAGIQTLNQFIPGIITTVAFIWIPALITISLVKVWLISTMGFTPGKFILGLSIADKEAHHLSFTRAFFRETIAKGVSRVLFSLGLFAAAIHPEHQAWHDELVDSYVYKHDHRLLPGIIVLIFMLVCYGFLIASIVHTFQANTNLINDIAFIFEPLTQIKSP